MSNDPDTADGAEAPDEPLRLFGFVPADKSLVDEVIRGFRDLVSQPSIPPSQLRRLSFALLALERMPRTTPGVELDVTLSYRHENEMTYTGLYIGNDSFR